MCVLLVVLDVDTAIVTAGGSGGCGFSLPFLLQTNTSSYAPAKVAMSENATETSKTSIVPLPNIGSPASDDLELVIDADSVIITTAAVDIPEGCRKASRDFLAWENPDNLISMEALLVLETLVYCGLMPLLCIIGLVTNPCCCAVFYR